MAATPEEIAERRRIKAQAKAEKSLVEKIQTQGRLEKTNAPEAARGSFFSLPSGRVVSHAICERLISDGRIVACRDGLFDDSQTYVVAP